MAMPIGSWAVRLVLRAPFATLQTETSFAATIRSHVVSARTVPSAIMDIFCLRSLKLKTLYNRARVKIYVSVMLITSV
jgi:hypothetical protein